MSVVVAYLSNSPIFRTNLKTRQRVDERKEFVCFAKSEVEETSKGPLSLSFLSPLSLLLSPPLSSTLTCSVTFVPPCIYLRQDKGIRTLRVETDESRFF